MTEIVKYPRVPHLAWLGTGTPRDDKLLSDNEVAFLLDGEVTVEEKVDGANLAIATGPDRELWLWNRGTRLLPGAADRQFDPVWNWLAPHRDTLRSLLHPHLTIFGEWCYARHSKAYTQLPDWYIAFDVYDRQANRFWSVPRRDGFLRTAGLCAPVIVARGRFDVPQLVAMIGPSAYGNTRMEGVVVRRDAGDWLVARAKLVAAEFTQAIETHWTQRPLERNQLARR